MVVDDVADNLFLLQIVLEAKEYEVDTASNGTQALAQTAVAPLDLILLDVMMPDMNGYEVRRRLRQNEQFPVMPIVLVTAQAQIGASEEMSPRANNRIYQPIDVDELLARISVLLQ
ncbi:response regulator [cyanobacterium TDX16]|nr:response regulator [cyanobacterium TDX16]